MNHDGAINAALLALGSTLTERHPDHDQAAAARFVLQQIRSGQSEVLAQDATVVIPANVLLQLLIDALKVPALEAEKSAAEKESTDLWNKWAAVKRFMREDAPHSKKQSIALERLGLIGNEAGKGGSRRNNRGIRRNYRAIAGHYHLLRTGGHHFKNGKLIAVEPHSFIDAVKVIEFDYEIDWRALVKGCQRNGITLEKKADVYPID